MKNRLWFILALFLISTVGRVSAQLLIVSNTAPLNSNAGVCSVLAYNFDGTLRNTIPLALTNAPIAIVTDGTNLFADYLALGVVGEYTTAGGIVNPTLISGLNNPNAMALSGTNLYIADVGRIGKYTTFGAVINSNFVTGIASQPAFGMVVLGTNLFAAINGTIQEFSTDGGIVNTSLVSTPTSTSGMATDGTNLFVSLENGTVAVYSTSGATISSILINGLERTYDPIAIAGTNLYIFQPFQMISQYSTSGALINPMIVSNATQSTQTIWGFTAVSSAVSAPPPATGITTYSNQPAVFWPARGNYTLQMTTNLNSTNWAPVSGYVPVNGVMVTHAPPSAFFRLKPITQ